MSGERAQTYKSMRGYVPNGRSTSVTSRHEARRPPRPLSACARVYHRLWHLPDRVQHRGRGVLRRGRRDIRHRRRRCCGSRRYPGVQLGPRHVHGDLRGSAFGSSALGDMSLRRKLTKRVLFKAVVLFQDLNLSVCKLPSPLMTKVPS